MGYVPPTKADTLTVYLGFVFGCTMTGGSPSGSPNCAIVDSTVWGTGQRLFTAADVGRTATVIGAGFNYEAVFKPGQPLANTTGALLKTTVVSVTNAHNAVLSAPAITSVAPNNNFTIYRPIEGKVNYVPLTPAISYNNSLTQKATLKFGIVSLDGSLIRLVPVALAHRMRARNGRLFDDAEKFKRKI